METIRKVFRGGSSSGQLYEELADIDCTPHKDSIALDFSLRSKGGGRTSIKIVLQYSDLIDIIEYSLNAFRTLRPEIARISKMLEEQDRAQLELSAKKAKEAQQLLDSLEDMTSQLRSLMWDIDYEDE